MHLAVGVECADQRLADTGSTAKWHVRLRDLAFLLLGSFSVLFLLKHPQRPMESSELRSLEGPVDVAVPWDGPFAPPPPPMDRAAGGSTNNFAFVQVVSEDPGVSTQQLWRAFAMAKTLRRLSRYPFVVIAELAGERLGGLPAAAAFAQLGAHLVPPNSLLAADESGVNLGGDYRRLYIWGLTQFEKVLWLDIDAVLLRGMDSLFDLPVPMAWREEVACPSASHRTALLLVQTSRDDIAHLAAIARRPGNASAGGVDALLASYFRHQFTMLPSNGTSAEEPWVASGTCLFDGRSHCKCPPVPHPRHGGLDHPMPALVFRSAPDVDCFSFDQFSPVAVDVRRLRHSDSHSGQRTDVCHHPIGIAWRESLCQAASVLPSWPSNLQKYCDDALWFRIAEAPQPKVPNALDRLQICNAYSVGGSATLESPVYEVSDEENDMCFQQLRGLSMFEATSRAGRRKWCWVGMKEYGCHHNLWQHHTWSQMHLLAVDAHATLPLPEFSPLARSHICDKSELGVSPKVTAAEVEAAHSWFHEHVAVYVLALKNSSDRKQSFTKHMRHLNLSFEVVRGIDFREPHAWERTQHLGIIPASFDLEEATRLALSEDNEMGPILGTLGCASGHLHAQATAAKNRHGRPISLIFEDDVEPAEDFVVRVWKLVTEELPCDWQVVSLRTGCGFGACVTPRLTRVQPDINEPARRCRHGVNWGFQGMVYRTSELMFVQQALRATVFDSKRPHCLDVDVALASLSDSIRYYGVPAVQDPGFLVETGQTSQRYTINMNSQSVRPH